MSELESNRPSGNHPGITYRIAKRTLDIMVAIPGLIVASPVLVGLAIWVKVDSEGPVFYRGRRIGRNGQPFGIFKYRSMVVNADKIGGPTTSEDDPRVTKSGRFIRRYKLDELPQLINILTGDMSLVGPRPDVPSEVDKLSPEDRAIILAMRPGMTDWASIQFNNEGEIVQGYPDPHKAYEEIIRPHKIRLQRDYVKHASISMDMKILWGTFQMLWGTRVSGADSAAPPEGQS